jgi:ketosteroid isomerase-like protein
MTDALALAHRFVSAIEAGDFETMRACYAPRAQIWHNTDGLDAKPQDRDTNVKSLKWMRRFVTGMRYDIARRERTDTGFLQTHVLRATTTLGEPFALPAAVICTVENGAITRLDEYFSAADLAPLMRAVEAGKE